MRNVLLSLIAVAAGAQPIPQASQYGLLVDDQASYLFISSDPVISSDPSARNACMSQRELALLQRLAGIPNAGFQAPAATDIPCAEFETWHEPLPKNATPSVQGGIGVERGAAKSILQRFVRDNRRRIAVSYSVTVEAMEEAGAYRVTFGESNSGAAADFKTTAPVRLPVPQIVHEGEEIPVELYAAGPDGIKLVDYVRMGRRDKMARRVEVPRDSYAEDAEFTLSQARLSANGVAQEAGALPVTIRGGIVWMYVPGFGRYVLAFAAHPEAGFTLAGEAAGDAMTLVMDGNVFRIGGKDRIAAGGGIYNVYARRDAEWQPADAEDRKHFWIGMSPGIETAGGPPEGSPQRR